MQFCHNQSRTKELRNAVSDKMLEAIRRKGLDGLQSHHVALHNNLVGTQKSGSDSAATKMRVANTNTLYLQALSNDMDIISQNDGLLYHMVDPNLTKDEKKERFDSLFGAFLREDYPQFDKIINAEFITDFIELKWGCDPYMGAPKCHKGMGGMAFLQQDDKVSQQLEAKYKQYEAAQ